MKSCSWFWQWECKRRSRRKSMEVESTGISRQTDKKTRVTEIILNWNEKLKRRRLLEMTISVLVTLSTKDTSELTANYWLSGLAQAKVTSRWDLSKAPATSFAFFLSLGAHMLKALSFSVYCCFPFSPKRDSVIYSSKGIAKVKTTC